MREADSPQIVTRVLLDKSNYTDSVTQSPYFSGIITGSMVWVTYAWLSRLINRESISLFVEHAMAIYPWPRNGVTSLY